MGVGYETSVWRILGEQSAATRLRSIRIEVRSRELCAVHRPRGRGWGPCAARPLARAFPVPDAHAINILSFSSQTMPGPWRGCETRCTKPPSFCPGTRTRPSPVFNPLYDQEGARLSRPHRLFEAVIKRAYYCFPG